MPYVGNEPTSNFASVTKDAFSGDGSTTAFTLSKAATTNGVAVFVENVRQEPTTAYAVSGTTLTFTAAPVSASGNNIYVLHHNAPASTATHPAVQALTATSGAFTSGVTIQTTDNSDTLQLISTDADADVGPSLNLYRNSASPADGDSIGDIEFEGRNDASEDVRYARIRGRIDDASNGTEDSKLIFEVIAAGSQQEAVRYEPSGVVFNETSNSVDFRIESNGKTHAFFVDGSADNIAMGTTTPTFATGNGLHLGDDFHLGFGDGNGTRPDFQLGYDATNTRLSMKCGTGSDDTDIMITTGGNFVLGGDSVLVSSRLSVSSGGTDGRIATLHSSGTGATDAILFQNDNGDIGNIRTSGSATAYNTSSDYRLKENVNYSWDATTRLKQLKPARFNFKADADLTVDGFLAHEVSSIVPEAISGIKDEVDEDKKPVYQGIDQSKLVPLLVKTIQELEARVTTLESA